MANKKFSLGILAIVLVFGMAVVGCDEETEDDPVTYITWRSEIVYDNSGWRNIGTWTVGTLSSSDYKQLFFDNGMATDASNPSPATVRAGLFGAGSGQDYALISKDDKPAGEESSFTIKAPSGNEYTIKYILTSANIAFGGSIEITDIGGIDNGSDNFQNHIAKEIYLRPAE